MNGKSVLITGGTGTFGQAFIKYALENYSLRRLIVFSRDEFKQYHLRQQFDGEPMRYFIGDVRDLERLRMAFRPVDIIIHAAALKHVPTGEYNPIEVIKTNVTGAGNVITAAIEQKVEKVIALSTDKAVNPVNLYGSTKLCAEKLFLGANALSGEDGTRFSVARYGNVLNSRGSVIPFFKECAKTGSIPITHNEMTRFFIKIEDAAKFVADRLKDMHGGEIFVPKMPMARITTLARAIGGDSCEYPTIGIRPGEKIHETLISPQETCDLYNSTDYYTMIPRNIVDVPPPPASEPMPQGFHYTSRSNAMLTEEQIKEMIDGI